MHGQAQPPTGGPRCRAGPAAGDRPTARGPPYTPGPVNPALLALGVAVTLAAVLAVSARDPRLATIGLVAVIPAGFVD